MKTKAEIYFIGEIEQRITIEVEGDIMGMLVDIGYAVAKYGNGQKLHSIYFREEETK